MTDIQRKALQALKNSNNIGVVKCWSCKKPLTVKVDDFVGCHCKKCSDDLENLARCEEEAYYKSLRVNGY